MTVLTAASLAAAQGPATEQGLRPSEVTQGSLLFRTDRTDLFLPAPILNTDVEILVTGLISRATVRQRFQNMTAGWVAGIYVFPLPDDAAVDHLRMRVGPRLIEGVIRERGEAKQTYEQAKREGKRASLVEQERPNIFTTSVANIGPGDEITVEIEYQQTLRLDQGRVRLRFPMVVGPRYIPGTPQPAAELGAGSGGRGWAQDTDRVTDASRITPPVRHPSKGPINPVTLTINLAPGFPLAHLTSSYHPIEVGRPTDDRYLVTLTDGPVPADRDFELVWQPAEGQAPTAAVFTQQREGETYALVLVTPPAPARGPVALEMRGLPPQHRTPREVIFVIDTSGSMHGRSIEEAKAALQLALSRLAPADTFNIIQFNSWTDALYAQPQPATRERLAEARRYVERLCATGGTEMLPALQRALSRGEDSGGRLRQVIFLTDGAIGDEVELFGTIQQRLGESRLFTIGIGSAPNSHFMHKAAQFGRGTYTYIGKSDEVQEKMGLLFQKLEQPALTDLELELPSAANPELYPGRIPDLYLGEPLLIALKADRLPDHVRVRGGFGPTPWQTELSLAQAESREGLSVYWARQKIVSLTDEYTGRNQETELRQAVLAVALRFHLVSRYTSLVAVDVTPVRPAESPLKAHALETNLPHGWDYTAVFGLPNTATDARVHVLLGLLALLSALAIWRLRGQAV
jgi:Ca-activated chloride channel family protein